MPRPVRTQAVEPIVEHRWAEIENDDSLIDDLIQLAREQNLWVLRTHGFRPKDKVRVTLVIMLDEEDPGFGPSK